MTQDGRWVYARDLQVDDVVRSHSFGTQKISALESSLMQTVVYNFLTDDLHNYAVGQNGILVHNQSTTINNEIVEHVVASGHFPKKSAVEIKALLETTIKNGKSITDPGGVKGRILYYDSNTRIVVIYDGKGSGTMFRPESVRAFKNYIKTWKMGNK
jgi:hypothetical protein